MANLTVATFVLVGAAAYLFPEPATHNFAWRISPLMAMTVGSWFLGGGYVAWRSARLRAWTLAYPGLIFLGAFGFLELVVLLVHRSQLRLSTPLAIGYVGALVVAFLSAFVWLGDWRRSRDRKEEAFVPPPLAMRILAAGFVIFAGYFAIRLMTGRSRGGRIWPDELDLLTARSMGAFYLALSLAVLPLVWSKSLAPIIALLPGAVVGSILLIIPALVYNELFDFGRPGSLVFIGTYLFVLVAASAILIRNRGTARAPSP